MADNREGTDRIRFSQVVAGALAAVTAALIGSTMGVAGTVAGAGLASVISTVGGALYLRSIQRTREGVLTVRAKVVGRSGGATVLVSEDGPATGEVVEVDTSEADTSEAEHAEQAPDEAADRPPEGRRRRWPALVVTSVAAFVLGMLVITGVEWVKGEPLSGGSGTTLGGVVAPHRDSGGGGGGPADPTSTTTPTTTTEQPSPDRTTTTNPTSTTTTPPSDSSTSSTPSVTTTTEQPASGASNPPSE